MEQREDETLVPQAAKSARSRGRLRAEALEFADVIGRHRRFAEQRPDGGWAFSRLYPWTRSDDKQQDLESSDGYGTGFAVFVLRQVRKGTSRPPAASKAR